MNKRNGKVKISDQIKYHSEKLETLKNIESVVPDAFLTKNDEVIFTKLKPQDCNSIHIYSFPNDDYNHITNKPYNGYYSLSFRIYKNIDNIKVYKKEAEYSFATSDYNYNSKDYTIYISAATFKIFNKLSKELKQKVICIFQNNVSQLDIQKIQLKKLKSIKLNSKEQLEYEKMIKDIFKLKVLS